MRRRPPPQGRPEVKAAYASARSLFIWAGIFSLFVNLLMLTSPLYMLHVYDNVLASNSVPTLVALSVMAALAFLVMGLLEYLRGRIVARAGARFQASLDMRVMRASLRRAVAPNERNLPNSAARDLESVQQFLSSPAPFAFFDAPWTPIYLAALYLFHPLLGIFSALAGVLLLATAYANDLSTRTPERDARQAAAEAEDLAQSLRREAESVRALGMVAPATALWSDRRAEALVAQMRHSDRTGVWQSASKTFRMFLQSAILGLGAWLAVRGDISPGTMIAASILMGRALAPLDQAIAQWRLFLRARQGNKALIEFLEATPHAPERIRLPEARGQVDVRELVMAPPGMRTPTLRGVGLSVSPGEAVGVIGPSASGKSTLARGLAGIWPVAAGEIRLDGATLSQWDETQLGDSIGYLPQDVGLFNGTVAENIARMQPDPDPAAVIDAAKQAGAHEMVLRLAEGYDTRVGAGGAQLSGGQRQRVGLARALYGDPAFLILDEPNANLDAEGEQALVKAIRGAKERGRSVVVMAHRPSAIAACDRLLMLRDGRQQAYGPRDEVLRQVTSNHAQTAPQGQGQAQGQPQRQPTARQQQPNQPQPAARGQQQNQRPAGQPQPAAKGQQPNQRPAGQPQPAPQGGRPSQQPVRKPQPAAGGQQPQRAQPPSEPPPPRRPAKPAGAPAELSLSGDIRIPAGDRK